VKGWTEVAAEAMAFLHRRQQRHGPPQAELAAQLGMTQSTVSQMFTGRHPNWKIASLVRLATALGYEVEISLRPIERPGAGHVSFTETPCRASRNGEPHPRHTWSHESVDCFGHVCPGGLGTQPCPKIAHESGVVLTCTDHGKVRSGLHANISHEAVWGNGDDRIITESATKTGA
jgi:transcriptional regulator with XRE-family HTH domain